MHTPQLIAVELVRQRRRDIERDLREAGRLSTARAHRRRRRIVRRIVLVACGRRPVHG